MIQVQLDLDLLLELFQHVVLFNRLLLDTLQSNQEPCRLLLDQVHIPKPPFTQLPDNFEILHGYGI